MLRRCINYIRRKFRVIFKKYFRSKDIALVKDKSFIIISDDCWGGSIYQWYKRAYNTPFIGVFLYAPCYMKLLSNFDYYMEKKLEFVDVTKYPDLPKTYPVGLLEDIEIHFPHYATEEDAEKKWNRRACRMLQERNKDNYFFKFSDGAGATAEDFEKFHKLPFKNKLSFSVKAYESLKGDNHIKLYESYDNKNKRVPNGVKLFKLTFIYFNLNKWFTK
ncbi:MAG: DUF1919 domain-containing protein [Gammaproteobacteria bacterium]|nr:DUF1919 domain-containing protein [Gammaproteobacteria bacterium]